MTINWQKVVIESSVSIKDALKVIDKEALRVALVVESNKLVGMVTDGDVRRGILKGIDLNDPVDKIMNKSPLSASINLSTEELKRLMQQKQILSLPLVDEQGELVGLKTLHETLTIEKRENPVFIMAGGFGTPLRPLTDTCPKPMLKVGDKPILEILMQNFIKAGFVNFYISTHFMPEKIHEYFGNGTELGVNIVYVHEETPLGTGGALGLLPESLPKNLPLIMINGDVLTTVDFERLLKFHNENQADATMCVREYDYQIPYGVINGEGNKITSMIEKPIQRYFVNAGIYVVSPKVINSVPENYKIDMPTLLEQHMQETDNILMFPIHEYWLDIGRMDDFKRAQVDIHALGLL